MERLSADLDRLRMGDAGAPGRGIGDEGWVIVCAMPRLNVLKRDLPVLGACGIRGFGGVESRRIKVSIPVLATEDYDQVSIDMACRGAHVHTLVSFCGTKKVGNSSWFGSALNAR